MNVSSVGSAYASYQPQTATRTPEAAEAPTTGGDSDGDSDDSSAKVTASAPTVNLSGQKIGSIINVTA